MREPRKSHIAKYTKKAQINTMQSAKTITHTPLSRANGLKSYGDITIIHTYIHTPNGANVLIDTAI